MTKKSFSFYKDFFGSGLLEVLANRKLVHHFLPFDSAQGKLLGFGGDMKAFYLGLHY
jgi:hypothetical protein